VKQDVLLVTCLDVVSESREILLPSTTFPATVSGDRRKVMVRVT
jgi:hypothetical protein